LTDNLKNSELNALISLLDEPSTTVYDKIRGKIVHYGIEAIPYLENAWDTSFNNEIQFRVEDIIHTIQMADLKHEFKLWKEHSRINLLKGFYLSTKYQYPDLSFDLMEEKIENVKKDIWLELNTNLTALEKVKVVNHIFFEVHRFSGNTVTTDAPQNLFLNNLLETKKGNHLTIGMLYIILAQKLGMPIYGVDLPQHFILAYADEIQEGRTSVPDDNEVLFYINPFNKGAVFTQREIELFVKHLKLKPSPTYYQPCDNLIIVKRLLENLIVSYNKQGQSAKAVELKSLADVLTASQTGSTG
jgi:regulator of sirC expression with transglutaminase-like and TPR domain